MSDPYVQYQAVRTRMGSLDLSEKGKIAIRGADRYTWLQGMVSNDTRLLANGITTGLQACILDATGHILTDLTLIDVRNNGAMARAAGLPEGDFVLAVLPRANVAGIMTLLDRLLIMEDVELTDASAALGCVSFQGPQAESGWQTRDELSETLWKGFAENYIVVEADHTGSGGVDVFCPREAVDDVLHAIKAEPVSEAVQEVLRIEVGIPKYGAELDESVIALEANLGPTHISMTKGCYVGQEIIARIHSRGHTNRALTGLVFPASAPQVGDKIYALTLGDELRETGRITSVAPYSPVMEDRPIAMGYVRHEHNQAANRLVVGDADHPNAIVVPLPFYRKPTE